jgi:hypothetical protein
LRRLRALAHDRDRRRIGQAVFAQFGDNAGQGRHRHQKDRRRFGIRQLRVVEARVALERIFVSGRDRERGVVIAVRHRNPGIGRHGDRRRDAGDDLERHAGRAQRLCFFAAARENEHVAALEAHDALSLTGELHAQGGDLVLGQRVRAGALADVNAFAIGRGEIDDRLRREVIVEKSVAVLHRAGALERQKARITGPRTNKPNLAALHSSCA